MIEFEVDVLRRELSIDVEIDTHAQVLDVETSSVVVVRDTSDLPTYEGSYEVIPKMTEQTLDTKRKYMTDDVRIKGVPVYKTKNDKGGYTVYIATEEEEYGSL